MFSVEAGPYYPVKHNQADKGHFTLYGLGQRWATDCGYANEHGPEGRGQTLGHSCVLIDGQGQALSGAGLGTSGKIARYANDDRCGYALADCTEAYNRNMDDLRKDERPHEFAWQMMFSDTLEAALAEGRAVFEPRPPAVKTVSPPVPAPTEKPREARPRLVLRIHADATPVLSTDVFQPKDSGLVGEGRLGHAREVDVGGHAPDKSGA